MFRTPLKISHQTLSPYCAVYIFCGTRRTVFFSFSTSVTGSNTQKIYIYIETSKLNVVWLLLLLASGSDYDIRGESLHIHA